MFFIIGGKLDIYERIAAEERGWYDSTLRQSNHIPRQSNHIQRQRVSSAQEIDVYH
jgi:hypothetical protein